MTLELWLSIVMMCFMFFGVPKERKTVTIEALKGTIEIKTPQGKVFELKEGEIIKINGGEIEFVND